MLNSLRGCLWSYSETLEVKKGEGLGDKDRTAQSPPSLHHPYPQVMQRTDTKGVEWDKGSRGEKLGTSMILRVDSVSKTKLRQEKEKEKKNSECQRQQILTSKGGGSCCGIWLRSGRCSIGRHLHGAPARLWLHCMEMN